MLCLLLQLPPRVKSRSKVSLVPGQIYNLPPCADPLAQCEGLTLPGTVPPLQDQRDIIPGTAPKAADSP